MGVFETILAIVIFIVSVLLIGVIMMQKNRDEGMGAYMGGTSGGFEGQRGRSVDHILSRWTRILGIVFGGIIVIGNIILFFVR